MDTSLPSITTEGLLIPMPRSSRNNLKDFPIWIRNKRWLVRFVKSSQISRYSYGECDWPQTRNPKIFVRKNLSDAQLLNTTIHEILHAVRPELCEEAVLETANVITASLRKMGINLDCGRQIRKTNTTKRKKRA